MDVKKAGTKKDDMIAQAILLIMIFIIVLVVITVILCEKYGGYGLIFPLVVVIAIVIYSNMHKRSLECSMEMETKNR